MSKEDIAREAAEKWLRESGCLCCMNDDGELLPDDLAELAAIILSAITEATKGIRAEALREAAEEFDASAIDRWHNYEVGDRLGTLAAEAENSTEDTEHEQEPEPDA